MFTTLTRDYATTRHLNAICCAERRARALEALRERRARLRGVRLRCC